MTGRGRSADLFRDTGFVAMQPEVDDPIRQFGIRLKGRRRRRRRRDDDSYENEAGFGSMCFARRRRPRPQESSPCRTEVIKCLTHMRLQEVCMENKINAFSYIRIFDWRVQRQIIEV